MTIPDTGPWGLWHPKHGWTQYAFGSREMADDAVANFWGRHGYTVRSFTQAAVEAERERCAKIAEAQQQEPECPERASYIAAAIRGEEVTP